MTFMTSFLFIFVEDTFEIRLIGEHNYKYNNISCNPIIPENKQVPFDTMLYVSWLSARQQW